MEAAPEPDGHVRGGRVAYELRREISTALKLDVLLSAPSTIEGESTPCVVMPIGEEGNRTCGGWKRVHLYWTCQAFTNHVSATDLDGKLDSVIRQVVHPI